MKRIITLGLIATALSAQVAMAANSKCAHQKGIGRYDSSNPPVATNATPNPRGVLKNGNK